MKTRMVDGVEVQQGSGNVFADIGLADAETLKRKSDLVIAIRKAVQSQGLTGIETAKRMGISEAKVFAVMRGEFGELSERNLMDCLNRLG